MPVINGVYLKDFPALPSSVVDANIIPIAESGNQVAYRTTVGGIVTDARVTGKVLTGLSVTGGAIASTDTILQAFGKVQNQLNNRVTSVGLSMPSAFTVTNSPVTGTGTLTVTGAGLASQYIRGDGQLADFPTGGGGGSSVSYYLNGSVNQGTFSGDTYYEMNKNAILGAGTDFTISADGYIASFITDANDPNLLLIPGGNWNLEFYFSASSGGGNPSFYVELSKWDGSSFTAIASNSSSPELIAFGTSIQPYFATLAVPETVLLATDRLAIRVYVNHSGRTITLHTENNTLCQIITTFTTGLQSLNGLTKQTQFFSVGTSGTDFNISSATDTHTFNIPDASATARGVVTTGSQSFAGNKFFGGNVTFGTGSSSVFDGSNGRLILDKLRIYNTVPSTQYSDFVSAATSNRSITIPDASGTLALTSNLSAYLPLTGGTLTGALAGTSANFSGQLTLGSTITNGTFTYTLPGATGTLALTSNINTAVSGTTNYIPKFTSANVIADSVIYETASNILINTTENSGYRLDVNGTGRFTGNLRADSFIPTLSTVPANGMYLPSANTLGFATNSVNRLSISSAGAATFSSGIGIGGETATTGGIQFPATQVAIANANNLDDYEEGDWTIGLTFNGASVGMTTSVNAGKYTKIGRQVTVTGYLQLTNKGSSVGNALITGLPFTIGNADGFYVAASFRNGDISFADQFIGYGIINSSSIGLNEITNAGVLTSIDNTNFANTSSMLLSLTYFV